MNQTADPQLIAAADTNATVLNVGGGAKAGTDQGTAAASSPWTLMRTRLTALSLQQRLILAFAMMAVLVTVIVVATSGRKGDDWRVLFSNINERDGAAIVAALQQMNVPYKFTEGGAALMVPGPTVHETRLRLAGQGLPKSGTIGFELLENQKLGTSQFVEQINYQRGLEGELARSIMALSQVKEARVHLAVPKQSAFVREQQRPSASVVLSMYPGRFLDEQQVIAITHLVGSSVPQLGPQNVTVLDAEGNMLAPNPQRNSVTGLDTAQLKYVSEIEGVLSKRIATILEPVAGRDNVRAQVTVDVDFSQQERTEEQYKPNSPPNQQAIRSQQNLEAAGPVSTAGGIPGALTNQPPPVTAAPIDPANPQAGGLNAQGGPLPPLPQTPLTTSAQRKEQTVNYEVDKMIQHTKGGRGAVKRVSAAVIVNYKNVVDKGGKVTPKAFSPDELQQMTALVRDAIGFSQPRGDSVSVANIPFTVEAAEEVPFHRQPGIVEMFKDVMRFLIIITVFVVLFFGVVRPMLLPPPLPEVAEEQNLEDEFDEKVKAELASMSPQAREKRRIEIELERERRRLQEEEERMRQEEERQRQEEIRKRQEEEKQREYDELLEYAKDYVLREPRVVASVFKEWIARDG